MKRGYQGNVLLVELIVVVLFFSLSAVISLGVFVRSRVLETQNAALGSATTQARSWLEALSCREDAEAYLAEHGFAQTGGAFTLEAEGVAWRCDIARETTGAGTLVRATFTARQDGAGQDLTTLSADHYFPGEAP